MGDFNIAKTWWRRAGQWLAGTLVLPLLLLAVAEAGLRLAGYGHATTPFLKKDFDGEARYVRNKAFLELFFAQPIPHSKWEWPEFELSRAKPRNAYRIFVFGGSAAMGWPSYEYAFPRLLETMLEAQYPECRFEVYNAAFWGVNSHVMALTARACTALEPDLFIVYMGNNEVHGPFGLITAFEENARAPSPAVVRARVWLHGLRLAQFLAATDARTRDGARAREKTAALRPDDARLAKVYQNFERNLDSICALGAGAGAQTILCSAGANLRHWPPTAPMHLRTLPESDLEAWERAFREGVALEEAGEYAKAISVFQKAAAVDDTYAELQFRMGRCYWHAQDFGQARSHFERALELDSFQWVRAKADVNAAIKRVATQRASRGVHYAATAERLAARSPHGIPGIEVFADACHLNLQGSYEVASTLFEQVVTILHEGLRRRDAPEAKPLSQVECAQRLGLTPAKRLAPLRHVVRANQLLGKEPLDLLTAQIRALEDEAGPDPPEELLKGLRDAIELTGGDYYLRYEYARRLLTREENDEALRQARALVAHYPYRRGSHRVLGRVLARLGELDEARREFAWVLAAYPDDGASYGLCSAVLERMGKPEEAEAYLQEARALGYDKNGDELP